MLFYNELLSSLLNTHQIPSLNNEKLR